MLNVMVHIEPAELEKVKHHDIKAHRRKQEQLQAYLTSVLHQDISFTPQPILTPEEERIQLKRRRQFKAHTAKCQQQKHENLLSNNHCKSWTSALQCSVLCSSGLFYCAV